MLFETTRRTSWMQGLGWAAGAVLALWVLAWLAVPPLLKAEIEKQGSATLGRAVTVSSVDFRPWSLLLTVSDLAIAAREGGAPQFTVARIEANLELESLLRMAPVLDALTIDAPHLNLAHTSDGHYDVDDILAHLKAPPDAPPSQPFQFALYNVTIHGGTAYLTDQVGGDVQKHHLRNLQLSVPFLSNLDYRRTALVKPHLSFELNGTVVDTRSQGTPFDVSPKGDMHLQLRQLDLKPWLPYVPAGMPVRPTAGLIDADLQIMYALAPTAVVLSGSVEAKGLALADGAGAEVLRSDAIRLELGDVRPLEHVAHLQSLTLDAPSLHWVRKRVGRLKVDVLDPAAAPVATKNVAVHADSTGDGGSFQWSLSLQKLQVHRGKVAWRDENFKPAAALVAADLELQASSLQWPLAEKPLTAQASVHLLTRGKPSGFAFHGEGNELAGMLHLDVQDGALALAAPWLSDYFVPSVSGTLDTALDLHWQSGGARLDIASLNLSDVVMSGGVAAGPQASPQRKGPSSADLPRFKRLEIRDAAIAFTDQIANLGKVNLVEPHSGMRRDETGQWMFQTWRKTGASQDAPAPHTGAPWRVRLDSLNVSDASVVLSDRSTTRPVRLELTGLSAQTGALDLEGKQPVALSLTSRLRSGQTDPGSVKFKGTVMWAPVAVQGSVEALDVPAHALIPYLADHLNLDVLRADANIKGQVRYAATPAGPQVQLQVDAALEDFRANTVAASAQGSALAIGEELLRWKALNLSGVVVNMVPGAPARVAVREAALTDFYARIAVEPDGHINLQDVFKPAAIHPNATPQVADGPAAQLAQIKIGPVSLVQGSVVFSDQFIRPNYTASLSELTGRISQFATHPAGTEPVMADLELRGRAEGTAALEITGKVNPLARPLALDIRGRVRDLELPPLSPYAIKYAGYGVERGKLSMDVHYQLGSDGQLSATNQLTLHQLAFGDAVEGAPNSLPVKLAAALLADDNGVIDLDLPISGSLNDPQFSVGPVVWKIINNLIAKALTSPFSLLSGGGGGSDDLGRIAFAPGSSALTKEAKAGLDQVAQSLRSKPALILTVTGTANLDAERDALKRERLGAMLLSEKRRRLAGNGQDAAAISGVTADEAPALLRAVYRRAEINKPRNFLGLTKELEPREMESMLMVHIVADADAMRTLATARSVAVKDYLAEIKLPQERLFLGSARVEETPVAGNSAVQPGVLLSLTHP